MHRHMGVFHVPRDRNVRVNATSALSRDQVPQLTPNAFIPANKRRALDLFYSFRRLQRIMNFKKGGKIPRILDISELIN